MLGGHVEEWDRCQYVYKTNHISTDADEREQFAGYVSILAFKMRQQGLHYNKEVIESLLRSILFDYLELMMSVEALLLQSAFATKAGSPWLWQKQSCFLLF